ncbi:MAG: hypothetical protein AB1345_10910 [Chloroflexota bacterium]
MPPAPGMGTRPSGYGTGGSHAADSGRGSPSRRHKGCADEDVGKIGGDRGVEARPNGMGMVAPADG